MKYTAETIRKILRHGQKVLFVDHLAIGDFCYMKPVYEEFVRQHPHLQVDLLVYELRRTSLRDKEATDVLKNYVLYDWLKAAKVFHHVYLNSYTEAGLEEDIRRAAAAHYDIVFSLATVKRRTIAEMCRRIAGTAPVVIKKDLRKGPLDAFRQKRAAQIADYVMNPQIAVADHESIRCAKFFREIMDINGIDWAQRVSLKVPPQNSENMKAWLRRVAGCEALAQPVIFCNPFAKNGKRTWPLPKMGECILRLQSQPAFNEAIFLINGMPSDRQAIASTIAGHHLRNTYPFSAENGFFDLPAMISLSKLVISVETSVMHIASILRRPLVALMRLKTPHWRPIGKEHCRIIWNHKRHQQIKDIDVAEVLSEVNSLWEEIRGKIVSKA